jgi:hypothetical protein
MRIVLVKNQRMGSRVALNIEMEEMEEIEEVEHLHHFTHTR